MAPWARGRGVATRAVRAVTAWALRDAGLARVVLRAAPGNTASCAVARAAGYAREGIARDAGLLHDGRTDLCVHSFVKGDLP